MDVSEMNGYQKTCVIATSLLMLQSCAGRDAKPVSVYNAYDEQLSCLQLKAEVLSNEEKAKQLTDESNSSYNRNVAVAVVGAILFWPALFALDLSDAQKQEIEALRQRNAALTAIETKQCNTFEARAAPIVINPLNQAVPPQSPEVAGAQATPVVAYSAAPVAQRPAAAPIAFSPSSLPAGIAPAAIGGKVPNTKASPYVDPVCAEYESRPAELNACMRGRTPLSVAPAVAPTVPWPQPPATPTETVTHPKADVALGGDPDTVQPIPSKPLIFVKRVDKAPGSTTAAKSTYSPELIEGSKQFCSVFESDPSQYQTCIAAYLGNK